ncbi:MAG: hypothetical protein ACRDKH_02385, partial [Solirubrobacterales bacterium]
PSAVRCARLLRGEHGFWVAAHLDQADPPPAYGLFAHVRLDALRARVDDLAAAGGLELGDSEVAGSRTVY